MGYYGFYIMHYKAFHYPFLIIVLYIALEVNWNMVFAYGVLHYKYIDKLGNVQKRFVDVSYDIRLLHYRLK